MDKLLMKLVGCATMALFLYACSSDEEGGKAKQQEAILKSPAFAGITDSIERSPNNAELLLMRAMRLSQHNFHEAASVDYEKVYKMTGDAGVALEYASSLLLSSQVKRAIEILEEGNRKFTGNTEFSRRLAEIHLQSGHNKKALEQYNNILAQDSSNFEALFDKGSLLARTKDTAGAIAALERSFMILPINYTGMALASIYVARKDPRALEVCNIILERDSAAVQTEPLYMKGVYYTEVKDYDNALKQFDECIRRDWKMTDAYIEKGIIHYERKRFEEALKIFSMAATVSNTDADAYYWMGRCQEATGKKQEAIANYRRAIALDDTFSEAKDALRRLNS